MKKAVKRKAVPLFKYIEAKHGLKPIEAARKLGISRALYSSWRAGINHLRAWQVLHLKNTFDLDWLVITDLISKQYSPAEVLQLISSYLNPSSKTKR